MNLLIDAIRTILAVAMLVILPGYMLGFALFPLSRGDALSRFFFSVLMSICISVCSGYVLMRAGRGLRPFDLFFTLEVITFVLMIIGMLHYLWAKRRSSHAGSSGVVGQYVTPNIGGLHKVMGGVAVLVLAATAFPAVVSPTRIEEPMTEFHVNRDYILADGFVLTQESNKVTVPLAIKNLQGSAHGYSIVGVVDDEIIFRSPKIILENQQSWQGDVTILFEESWPTGSLDLLLFADGESGPVAKLDFWLSDTEVEIAQSKVSREQFSD